MAMILGLILLLSPGTVSWAAVDVGGNLRVWYKNGPDDTNTFFFDRLALKFNSSFTDSCGIKSEIRFKPSDGLKLEDAYYYQRNLLGEDEFDAGLIDIPAYNDQYLALNDTLGKNKSPGNSVGIKYRIETEVIDFSLALANANNESKANTDTIKGLDYGARISWKAVEGLVLSAAYDSDVYDNDNHSNTTLLVDAVYNLQSFGFYTEYVAYNPNSSGNRTGFYLEPSYAVNDQWILYAGTTLGAKDGRIAASDYQLGGVIFKIAPKTALQLEYLSYNEPTSEKYWNLRLKVDF